jgi:surfeit locus 1 family protein
MTRRAQRGQVTARFALTLALLSLLFLGFIALGCWQLQRRVWKLDLIQRVEQRISAAPIAAPPRIQWPRITIADEYTRVCLDGQFLHDRETQVQAVTERGPGFWVMTPLRQTSGDVVLVNRGFVPPEQRNPATRTAAQVTPAHICGLLRHTERRGGFLRRNDAVGDHWYSRDVAAIAAARRLPIAYVAPYFVDADATPNPGGWPVGGLTVIRFHNSHLAYAFTWFALALMTLAGAVIFMRYSRRVRERV